YGNREATFSEGRAAIHGGRWRSRSWGPRSNPRNVHAAALGRGAAERSSGELFELVAVLLQCRVLATGRQRFDLGGDDLQHFLLIVVQFGCHAGAAIAVVGIAARYPLLRAEGSRPVALRLEITLDADGPLAVLVPE